MVEYYGTAPDSASRSLALGHQLFWDTTFADDPPQLGGNLAGLAPTLQAVILRSFAVISSLITGTIVGAISGLIAWGMNALTRNSRPQR